MVINHLYPKAQFTVVQLMSNCGLGFYNIIVRRNPIGCFIIMVEPRLSRHLGYRARPDN